MRSGELTDRCVEAMNDARNRVLVHNAVSMTMANYHMVEAVMRVCLDAAAEVCDLMQKCTITTSSFAGDAVGVERLYPMPAGQIKARILSLKPAGREASSE